MYICYRHACRNVGSEKLATSDLCWLLHKYIYSTSHTCICVCDTVYVHACVHACLSYQVNIFVLWALYAIARLHAME